MNIEESGNVLDGKVRLQKGKNFFQVFIEFIKVQLSIWEKLLRKFMYLIMYSNGDTPSVSNKMP